MFRVHNYDSLKTIYAETGVKGEEISLAVIQVIRVPEDALWNWLFLLAANYLQYSRVEILP